MILLLALALSLPMLQVAWARDGGTVDLGVEVGKRVEEPAPGDVGEVSLGVAVGYDRLHQDGEFWGMDGWLEIGCAVGLDAIEPGEWKVAFHAGKGSFANGGDTAWLHGPVGAPVGEPVPDPKRVGWRFAGWCMAGEPDGSWDPEGASAIPLGKAWDFSSPMAEEGEYDLYARWELRLDVTVPVAVGVAVNADTHEVTVPEAGRYAVKSRTVRPVVIEEMAVETCEPEVRGFFRLPEGTLPEGASAAQERNAWTRALMQAWVLLAVSQSTAFPIEPDRDEFVRLGLAARLPEQTGDGWRWSVSRKLAGALRDSFTVPAFAYGHMSADDAWEGEERCERLAFDFDMRVGASLDVRVDVDSPQPVTRLRLTVSARP